MGPSFGKAVFTIENLKPVKTNEELEI